MVRIGRTLLLGGAALVLGAGAYLALRPSTEEPSPSFVPAAPTAAATRSYAGVQLPERDYDLPNPFLSLTPTPAPAEAACDPDSAVSSEKALPLYFQGASQFYSADFPAARESFDGVIAAERCSLEAFSAHSYLALMDALDMDMDSAMRHFAIAEQVPDSVPLDLGPQGSVYDAVWAADMLADDERLDQGLRATLGLDPEFKALLQESISDENLARDSEMLVGYLIRETSDLPAPYGACRASDMASANEGTIAELLSIGSEQYFAQNSTDARQTMNELMARPEFCNTTVQTAHYYLGMLDLLDGDVESAREQFRITKHLWLAEGHPRDLFTPQPLDDVRYRLTRTDEDVPLSDIAVAVVAHRAALAREGTLCDAQYIYEHQSLDEDREENWRLFQEGAASYFSGDFAAARQTLTQLAFRPQGCADDVASARLMLSVLDLADGNREGAADHAQVLLRDFGYRLDEGDWISPEGLFTPGLKNLIYLLGSGVSEDLPEIYRAEVDRMLSGENVHAVLAEHRASVRALEDPIPAMCRQLDSYYPMVQGPSESLDALRDAYFTGRHLFYDINFEAATAMFTQLLAEQDDCSEESRNSHGFLGLIALIGGDREHAKAELRRSKLHGYGMANDVLIDPWIYDLANRIADDDAGNDPSDEEVEKTLHSYFMGITGISPYMR